MERQEPIQRTVAALSQLPLDRAEAVADFAAYILMKYEEEALRQGIGKMVGGSKAFEFLKDEEDLYTVADLKEKYR